MKANKQPGHLELTTPAKQCKFELLPSAAPAKPDTDNDPEDQDEESLPTLVGYAIVWNATSADDRRARIAPGAVQFPDDSPVLALYAHDTKDVLGSTANGTLRLLPDAYGLRVEIDPPDTSYAEDVCELVEDQYVTGMSFGMYPVAYTDSLEDGETVRTYTQIVVDEVTITAVPAFKETAVALKFADNTITVTTARDEQSRIIEGMRFESVEID